MIKGRSLSLNQNAVAVILDLTVIAYDVVHTVSGSNDIIALATDNCIVTLSKGDLVVTTKGLLSGSCQNQMTIGVVR